MKAFPADEADERNYVGYKEKIETIPAQLQALSDKTVYLLMLYNNRAIISFLRQTTPERLFYFYRT